MMESSKNILFSAWAAQLNLVSPWDLVAIVRNAESLNATDLGQFLLDAGALSEHNKKMVSALVEHALAAQDADGSSVLDTLTDVDMLLGRADTSDASPNRAAPQMLGDRPRYADIAELARGGIGRVLLANDLELKRQIALKELLPAADVNPGSQDRAREARFLQEARITGQLEHPSIVPVHELGQRPDGTPYYTMKLVRGRTLQAALQEADGLRGRLELLPHLVDMCQAIAYAHSRGVVHRDIKPSNIMVGEFGETVVLDWGLAKVLGKEDSGKGADTQKPIEAADELEHTADGVVVGTPRFMSPEQVRGDKESIGFASDVYALGAVLYMLLTGKVPFKGNSRQDVLDRVAEGKYDPVQLWAPDAPRELVSICQKAMALKPAERYQTAGLLAADVTRFLTGRFVNVHQYNPMELLCHFTRQFKGILLVASICIGILLATGVVAYWRVEQERNLAIVESQNARKAEQIAEEARQDAEKEYYFAAIGSSHKSIDEFRFENALNLLAKCTKPYRHWEWGYALYLCNQDQRTYQAHYPKDVWSLQVARDGRHVFSAGFDNTAKVWNLDSGELEHTYTSPHGSVIEVAEHPGGAYIAYAKEGGFITLYDPDRGEILETWQVSEDGDMNCVQFSPDGRFFASGDDAGNIRIHEEKTRAVVRTMPSAEGAIEALAYSPDGSLLASANRGNKVSLWKPGTGTLVRTLEGHSDRVTSLAFDPSGTLLASGSRDEDIIVWALQGGELVQRLTGHKGAVWAVAFSPDGMTLASSSSDLSIRLWNTKNWSLARMLRGHRYQVYCLAFSPDGYLLFSGDELGATKQWDVHALDGPYDRWTWTAHSDVVNFVTYSPDGKTFVTGSGDRHAADSTDTAVRIWDGRSNGLLKELKGHSGSVLCAAFHPTERILATASQDGTSRVWDLDTGKPLHVLGPWPVDVISVAFDSAEPELMALGLGDGRIVMVNWRLGTEVKAWKEHESNVLSLTFSPDGRWLVSTSFDGTIHVLQAKSGDCVKVMQHARLRVTSAAFSSDGKWLATGGHDWNVFLWDTKTWESFHVFSGHTEGVYSVAFSDDGRRLLSSSTNGLTVLWDTATFREILQLEGLVSTFAPGGTDIVTGTKTGLVYHWPAFPWDIDYNAEDSERFDAERLESVKREFWKGRRSPAKAASKPMASITRE